MKDIIMPQFGETVEEEIVIDEWHKKIGDGVKVGDLLMTIETGKSTLEVEAADAGILAEILVPEGETTLPLKVVGRLQ